MSTCNLKVPVDVIKEKSSLPACSTGDDSAPSDSSCSTDSENAENADKPKRKFVIPSSKATRCVQIGLQNE